VTSSFFPLVGANPARGRFFTDSEDQATSSSVPCVMSDRLWRTEWGGDASAIGTSIVIGNLRCTFVGVAPKGFNGFGVSPVDVWLPLRAAGEVQFGDTQLWNTDRSHWLRLVARIRPGTTLALAGEDATRAYRTFSSRVRDKKMEERMVAQPLIGGPRTSTLRIRVARWLVGGAAALLLLVTANLVNLLVARNLGRVRETGIRLALGGGWTRLLRFHILESLLLSLFAGAAALLVVHWTTPLARSVLFPGAEFAYGPLNLRLIAPAIGASLLLGMCVALGTAWSASRVDPAALLAAGGSTRTTGGRGSRRIRLALVGVQAALSLILLVASTGFVRSFREATGTRLGFNIHGLIQAEIARVKFDSAARIHHAELNARLYERLRTMPGVASVSMGYTGPWWNNRAEAVFIPGRDSLPLVPSFGEPMFDVVTPGYLETMQLALRSGRWISEQDNAGAPRVIVISEGVARLYWPDEPRVIGKCMRIGEASATCREIIGVVADPRFTGSLDDPPVPIYFIPIAQAGEYRFDVKLFVRAAGDADGLLPSIRHLAQTIEPDLPAASVQLVQTQVDPLLAPWRIGALAFTALGVLAAIVAALGLFSVLAFLVAERRREFAIRGALGAEAMQILTPVLRQGIVVVAAGVVAGTGIMFAAARWLQPMLFHVPLLDPVVVATVIAGILVLAAMAASGPARAASRMDPMEALRGE
jgi:predicted permease